MKRMTGREGGFPAKRRAYDQQGHAAFEHGGGNGAGGPGGAARGPGVEEKWDIGAE